MNKNIREKFKQITLTVFAITLIGVGYMNFNLEQDKKLASKKDKTNIGDVELVSSSNVEKEEVSDTTEKTEEDEIEVIETVNDEISDYFTNSKIERNKMYSEILENYQNMLNASNLPNEQKAIAINEITRINNEKNSIMIAENLIKNKGFEDVLILINNNNMASIVVKADVLTVENIAQIQNVISRQLQIDVGNINITNKY